MRRIGDTGVIVGSAALGAALLLFVTILGRGMADEVVESRDAAGSVVEGTEGDGDVETVSMRPEREHLTPEVLGLAVDHAPFEPNRRSPRPYRMPDDPVERPPEPPPELPDPPDFEVLGTVADADGGVAVIRVENGTPHVITQGQELFGYTLASVAEAQVTMTGEGQSVDVAVAGPAATPRIGDSDRGSRRERRREQQREVEQRRQDMAERLQRMARQLQEQSPEGTRVEVDGNRLMIVGPEGQRREIRMRLQMQSQDSDRDDRRRDGGGGE